VAASFNGIWEGCEAALREATRVLVPADHLLSPDMFTGWGIRTLASSMARFNPMSYHNGSVWPHDNALCTSGLMRYGFVEHAQKVVTGLLEAAAHLGHRLPELFCGFTRDYPTSCSPQAWAAATPFSLLRSLLRFDPELPAWQVRCALVRLVRPKVPAEVPDRL
jgi:glycogen debranching enzyme